MGQTPSSPLDNSPSALSDSESEIETPDLKLGLGIDVTPPADPVLPIELERLIFELAFELDNPAINAKLILVSKRVYSWLKPLIFRVFIQIRTKRPYPDFAKIPQDMVDLSGICVHTRCILVDRSRHKHFEALKLLERCPNLEDVLCWRDMHLLFVWSAITKLQHLRRLSGNFYDVSLDHLRRATWTSNLTHLVLMLYNKQWKCKLDKELLDALPSLTHLGLLGGNGIHLEVLGEALKEYGRLKVLLYFTYMDEVADQPGFTPVYEREERMVVFNMEIYTPDAWIPGTRGGPDVWRWAEGVVVARQNRYFKSEEYRQVPINHGFPWREHLTKKGLEWFEANAHTLQIGV